MTETLTERMRHAAAHVEIYDQEWEAQQLRDGADEIERLRDALRELVACKGLKDSLPKLTHDLAAWGLAHADYQRRKPLAWDKALAALVPNACGEPGLTEPGKD